MNTAVLALQLVVGIHLKAAAILLVAVGLSVVLRRASAAARHAMWCASLLMLLLLPLISLALPSWELRERTMDDSVKTPALVHGSRRLELRQGREGGLEFATLPGGEEREPERPAASPTHLPVASLLLIWLGGAAIMLGRLALHVVRVGRLTEQAREAGESEAGKMVATLASKLGRPVRVVLSSELSMPFSWGALVPVISLPATAERWPREHLRSVLVHELAHVERWDYLWHLLAEVVRALYWLNPLVWLAAHRTAMERERACDDLVLSGGTEPVHYAVHLLDFARSQVLGHSMVAATSMAGEPGLKERIRCVVNRRLSRSPFPADALVVLCVLASLTTLPVATVDVWGERLVPPRTIELTRDLREDPDPMVRRRAAWWLGEHEARAAVPDLEASLRDHAVEVRLVAAWALGEIKDPASIPPLIVALEDRAPLVREMAALALGEIERPSAVPALVRAFEREEELGEAVVWALGEIRGGDAEQARARILARDTRQPRRNHEVWTGSLDLAGVVTFSEEVSILLADLASSDPETRRWAALKIGILGRMDHLRTLDPVEPLLDRLEDPVPGVRAAAVWALDEINPSRW